MRFTSVLLCLLMVLSLVLFSGCGNKPKKTDSESISSESSTVNDESSESTDSVAAQSDESLTENSSGAKSSTSKTNSKQSTSKAPFIPKDEAEKWGTEKGLTSTKKVPDWMRKIPSGKIVSLGSSKIKEDDLEYNKVVFKALTGKDLDLDQKIVEWNSLRTTLQTMVLSNNAPDIFGIYNGVGIYLRNKGLTRDIRDYINMNDAAWEDMKLYSEPLFYNGELTGVAKSTPLITGGFIYNKTLISQAGLDDPWELYKQNKWDINTFLTYVEELTVDKNHDGVAEVYGVSMAPETLFKMALSSGEDLVKLNSNGTFSNNLRSSTFTRWASYAARIKQLGSYDTESWTRGQRFLTNGVAMMGNNIWDMTVSKEMIAMKKQGKIGWVPHPRDNNSKKYYHSAEITYSFLPKNSKNPQGGAAYYYTQRYSGLNPNPVQEKKTKDKYINEYGWTLEEYEFQKDMGKKFIATSFNWMHIPDFSYNSLWKVFTDDWANVVEEVYPTLDSALKAQNK